MKSASYIFKCVLLLLILVTTSVVLLSISPLFTPFTLTLNSIHDNGKGFTSTHGHGTQSKISGSNTQYTGNKSGDSKEPHLGLPKESDAFWRSAKVPGGSVSLTEDRITLEIESYRYLHQPETLNKTYNIWRTQRLRRKVLHEACQEVDQSLEIAALPSHLLVDDRNKFVFCEVRKVSSIAWRRVLDSVALANSTGGRHTGLRRLGTYSARQRERRLRDYTKFMFVRDPMLRLVSGWRDKFAVGPQRRDYESYWGPRIRRFSARRTQTHSSVSKQQELTSLSSVDDQPVSFVEFVRYLTAGPLPSPLLRDMHWEPYHSRCRPCLVRYDFVGHYETLGPDAKAILGVLARRRGDRSVAFPAGRSGSIAAARQEFPKLAPEDISLLAKLYDKDYKLFGYSMDRFMSWLQ